MSNKRDPEHPVLREAWKHDVVGFHWNRVDDDSCVDLIVRHAETGSVKRLRFVGARDVSFSDAPMSWGLEILDVRSRQLEGISVQVSNFENAPSQVTLLARDVQVTNEEA